MRFDWDPQKDRENRKKHGFSLREARSLFFDATLTLEFFDDVHSIDEDRYRAIGPTPMGLLVVTFTIVDDDTIRIVSARAATRSERLLYNDYLRDLP